MSNNDEEILASIKDIELPIQEYIETLVHSKQTLKSFVQKKNKSGIAHFLYALTQGPDPLLRAYFFFRDEGNIVSCIFKASPDATGASGAVHGGLLTTLIDQCCGVAAFGRGIMGVTLTLSLSFKKFVPVDQWFEITARIGPKENQKLKISCLVHEIKNEHQIYVEAESLFLQRERKSFHEKVKSQL